MNKSNNQQKALDKIAVTYEKNPIIRAIMQAMSPFIPGASVIDAGFQATATRLREERDRAFFEELGKQGVITEEHLKDKDFVHACISTIVAVRRTRQEEKIHLFAHLLSNYAASDMSETADKYEEFLDILDDLSPREYQVLLLLNSMRFHKPPEYIPTFSFDPTAKSTEQQREHEQKVNEQEWKKATEQQLQEIRGMWKPFLWTAQARLNISSEEMPGILERIKRTGLYQSYSGLNANGDQGYLTPNFRDFLKMLSVEDEAGEKQE